jgi:hypothetical protein
MCPFSRPREKGHAKRVGVLKQFLYETTKKNGANAHDKPRTWPSMKSQVEKNRKRRLA